MFNGFNPRGVSTLDCRWKCQTVADSRMFVGNIEVIERGKRMYYNDMVLYSPVGKLDVFPYPTNILQVSTSDGDEIVALENHSHKLLQFKRTILYILDISSGEPANVFIESRNPLKGVISRHHVCNISTGIFWFNKFGAYIFDGESIEDVFFAGEEDSQYSRINKETWKTFVLEESDCSYNAESNEVIICRKVSQNAILDSGGLYDNDSDMYVYNVINKSWAFGNKRHRFGGFLSTSTDIKYRTNFVNIGDNQVLTTLFNNQADESSNLGELVPTYWQYKDYGIGEIPLDFNTEKSTLVTKLIDLGAPEVKKSILGVVFNMAVALGSSNTIYMANCYIRKGVKDPYQEIANFAGNQDGSGSTSLSYQHKFMFSPPFNLGWTQVQIKIEWGHTTDSDVFINDCYFIIRSHKGKISKASVSEDK